MQPKRFIIYSFAAAATLSGFAAISAGQTEQHDRYVPHTECSYFGKDREVMQLSSLGSEKRDRYQWGALTEAVTARMTPSFVPGGSRTYSQQDTGALNGTIDGNIYGVLKAQGITPAAKSNDYEFIRRVTLDLTGRIPTVDRVKRFVADASSNKRAGLIDELLASDQWVDKWTQYFGDLYKNSETIVATGLVRRANGRQAFYDYIKSSLTSNKPYDQVAREIISAQGTNSWDQGELNWILAGRIANGPVQDSYDQMASNVSDVFLGMAQFNCVLCHNGRGHLDTLSLWGKNATRHDAYSFSAYFAQTNYSLNYLDPANRNIYYWTVADVAGRTYALNTTTGNRPSRTPIGTERVVVPDYVFTGSKAPANDPKLRVTAAAAVTRDFQFARASVNYMWKEFFSRGLVDPVNQFDLARLDPDNPPPAPWTLQPSNAKLLKELSQDFISSGYNLKSLMRSITNSNAYQMSSVYDGVWKPEYEKLHARKLVRRLWAEEIIDAVAQSSNLPASYPYGIDVSDPTKRFTVNWAMQLPSPNLRSAEIAPLMDAFYRGDRDENDRRPDGSDIQALAMMNSNFVMTRTRSATTGQNTSTLKTYVNLPDDELVNTMYLAILSRLPNSSEKQSASAALKTGSRFAAAENLVWALYNKVDFFFNY